jgi:tetratricopeptide (TPR) repeat protein
VVEEIKQPPEARHETARQGSEQTPAVPEPEVVAEIALLQQRNAELEERLAKTEEKLQAIEARINAPQPQPSAAGDRLGDLEKQLSRLQAELGRTLSQAQGALAPVGSPLGTSGMTNLLAGSIVLLLIAILFLLRRQRAYIASLNKLAEGESSDQVEKRPEPGHVDDDLPEGVRTSKGIDEVATTQSSVEKPAEREVTAQPGERNIDPNMDYLGEAEVYLRYGMEDEAIENIRLAILQHPDNVEAHCKLIRLLAGKGDREALDLAIAAGRKALAGSARERFEDEVAQALGGGESPSETEASEPLKAAEGRDETVVSGTGVQEDGAEEISFVSETREDESLSDLGEIEWASLEEVTDAGEEQGVVDSYDELIKKESGSEPAPSQDLEEFDFELESPGEAEESRASVLPQTEPETTEEPATDQPQGGSGQSPLDLGPEPLLIDTGRSLLAAGSLDEAERLFRQALGGNQHGLALLGLAEIAKKRGDEESARSLLAQAEPLLDEASRDWFNRLTS